MANRIGWARGYPDGCANPDHPRTASRTQHPHKARGNCEVCYYREKRRADDGKVGGFPPLLEGNGSAPPVGDGAPLLVGDATPEPEVAVNGSDSVAPPPTDSPYSAPQVERRPGSVGTPSPTSGGAGPVATETPPSAPPRGLRRLFPKRGTGKDPESGTPALSPTREKRPGGGRSGKRESAAETISDGWAVLGGVAARTGHLPLGRCLQWQAPMAGEMLDDAIKGSLVDRVALQRIVKGRARFDLLGAVLGPPLIVFAIEQNPERAQALMPILASSIRHSLPLMVPAIKKMQKREAEVAAATELLFEDDPDFVPGTDPVEHILRMMFAGFVQEPAEVPDQPVGSAVA